MTKDRTGRLYIYLGAAPGVGKTCEMLERAHRLVEEGEDVVVGVVETHGRRGTLSLTKGLEHVPRRAIQYRGAEFSEMDLPGILERAPKVVLVDELAHTNAPGVENAKRWQDIRVLLDAGIDVLSTLNIQHLESLNDVVSRITGTTQRETVPDAVVRAADEIELVDISPEQLQLRLKAGNVYRPERVTAALGNYFRIGNLTALRELALLWLADRVDEALARYRETKRITDTWETRERVVVAVTGGAESPTMVRRASRIASRASAELVVVHVLQADGLTTTQGHMDEVRRLASGFGATVHTVVGDDIPSTLLEFARGVNATQLVIGTSRRSRIQRFFSEGIGAAVLRNSGPIDVHMVTHNADAPRRHPRPFRPRTRHILAWIAAFIVPLTLSLLLRQLNNSVTDLYTESSLLLVGVLAVSLLGGVWPATVCAVVSGIMLNFLFTPPLHSFTIAEPANILSLAVMMAVAIAVSALVDFSVGRHAAAVASTRDADLLSLFARAALRSTTLTALLEKVRDVYGQDCAALIDADGAVLAVAHSPVAHGRTTEGDATDGHSNNGASTAKVFSATCTTDSPTANNVHENADTDDAGSDPASEDVLGAEVPDRDSATTSVLTDGGETLLLWGRRLDAHDQRLLAIVAGHASALLRQQRLAKVAAETIALAEADRLRRSLLAAVGHDLRTPIAAAKLAVSSLRSDEVNFAPEDTAELLATVEESVDHLGSLVDNLLDSSRLAAGVIHPDSYDVDIEGVASRAVLAATVGQPSLRSRVHIDTERITAWADHGLLERVLANLIGNALRHAPSSSIRVTATQTNSEDGLRTHIAVADDGDGIAPSTRERIFEPFHRGGDANASSGIGLGLSVARGFTEAMGGDITITDTPGGGTTMVVDLPGEPPERPTLASTAHRKDQSR